MTLEPWQRRLAATATATVPALVVRLSGGIVPPPLQLLAYGGAATPPTAP